MPLDVVSEYLFDDVIDSLAEFKSKGTTLYLFGALNAFKACTDWDVFTMMLEVAKHFAEGAKKYSENNWMLGIPVKNYLDSAVRHYLKYRRGDKDENHDRAFCWNIMCAIWTCRHMPELNEYRKEDQNANH